MLILFPDAQFDDAAIERAVLGEGVEVGAKAVAALVGVAPFNRQPAGRAEQRVEALRPDLVRGPIRLEGFVRPIESNSRSPSAS